MEHYRERFKLGMERYKTGALAEAIGYWEPIYRELGEQKGYRLAYDLGIAYAELGDVTRAADCLQSFLAEVDARRARAEDLEPIVEKEETLARARIDALVASKGRIHIEGGTPPRAARIDAGEPRLAGFVAWVTPGEHTVTFAPGTPESETKTVDVRAGEIVDVAPTAAPAAAVLTIPATPVPSAPLLSPPRPPLGFRPVVDHPFSPAVVALGGGLTLAAGVLAVTLEANALSLHDRDAALVNAGQMVDYQNFDNTRNNAYVAVGGAVALAAVTAGLAAWYFFGATTREVVVTPAGVAGRFP
jgi:hypothetical protein